MNTKKALAELGCVIKKYSESSTTHERRFLMLMDKHKTNLKSWVDLVSSTPVNSVEFKAEVERLWGESKILVEQFQEVVQDMANDTDLLIEFFDKGKNLYSDIAKR